MMSSVLPLRAPLWVVPASGEERFSVPADWYLTAHSFVEKTDEYVHSCDSLGVAAVNDCLNPLQLSANQVDYIIFVSTTGLATPSIDARLINLLKMRSNVRRTPIWGLGCAGGAAGHSQSIPQIVKDRAQENLSGFVSDHNLTLNDISYLILHPGGAKVIEAYEAALSLTNGKLDICRQALRDYGNMSSVSVLFVLAEHMKQYPLNSEKYGLISALGPGFCSESLLVQF